MTYTAADLRLIADVLLAGEDDFTHQAADADNDQDVRDLYAERARRCTQLFERVCRELDQLRDAAANTVRLSVDTNSTVRPLPLHRTEAGYPNCSTCDGGGCLDCTDPA